MNTPRGSMRAVLTALLFIGLVATNATAFGAPGQVFSITVTPRAIPAPGAQDYANALQLARQAGSRGLFDGRVWSELEPAPGVFDLSALSGMLDGTAPPNDYTVLLSVGVVNTTLRETPSDLGSVPFDNPVMIARFHALMNAIRPRLTTNVKYLSIGNEVDIYLLIHPEEWYAYATFYWDAINYVHAIAPWIKVGFTTSYDGMTGADADKMAFLISLSDVAIATYYPVDRQTFMTQPPTAPLYDLPHMLSLAQGKPLVLQEVGYPSATLLGSSQQAQASFITNVMYAWRTIGPSVPFLNLMQLHDVTPQACDAAAAYYGLGGLPGVNVQNFKAHMCSLGVRNANGTPKQAWSVVRTLGPQ